MKKTVIKAKTLYDGRSVAKDKYILVENDKIIKISDQKQKFDYEGFVTPAFIDAHSHIGMFRDGEPGAEQEGNDFLDQFLPLLDPLNGIYFDDRAFKDAVDFGCLYSCVVPGSGNLMGGKAMIIRNFVPNRQKALIKNYGYKMALGYNPRSTTSWKGKRPNTRMGVYSLLEQKFDEVITKRKKAELTLRMKLKDLEKSLKEKKVTKSEYNEKAKNRKAESQLEFNSEELAIQEILDRKKIAKIHVHKEDDVLYLINFVKKYNIKATADHTGDVHHKEIFDELAKNKIPVIYGPLGALGGKVELAHSYYQNAALLYKSKVEFGLMTDHPVVWAPHLRDSLKFFLISGMSEAEAISLITYKNAKILGIDDILGSVEENKLASLVVWNKSPFDLAAFPAMVMAEGKVIRK
ncbi:MAG: amidohydrolase family protein [Candidatus Cloacimonetes bacterium]|nr:amidohydrolase family protein [Candidatus Cloacimonadota bacterium]